MRGSQRRWSEIGPVYLSQVDAAAPGRASLLRDLLRAVLTPANLVLAGTLAFGWLALIGWTGAGPEGWQARLCARLDQQIRSCEAVRVSDDGARMEARTQGSSRS